MSLNFVEIRCRLLEHLRDRIRNGEITERRLAALAGISQPHIHNVLKGVRNLSPELIDLVFKCLNCSVLDLCSLEELTQPLQRLCVFPEPTFDLPFVSSVVGRGRPWDGTVDFKHRQAVPCALRGLGQNLVLARLSEDSDMRNSLLGNNIAVLNLAESEEYRPDTVYVVDRGPDAVLRYIRPGLAALYLASDANLEDPARWEALSTRSALVPVVRARVCWLGKEARTV